jgi:hypothetical protein
MAAGLAEAGPASRSAPEHARVAATTARTHKLRNTGVASPGLVHAPDAALRVEVA